MRTIHFVLTLVAIVSLSAQYNRAAADSFGRGGNSFDIEFVRIGDPGNAADTTGNPNPAGGVDYVYKIGKYEISRDMIERANAEGALGIQLRDMTNHGGNGPNQPATGVTWFEAATFVNWLNTSSGYSEAYHFTEGNFELWEAGDAGYKVANPFRNSLAHYFLPSVHEWYKAAYYDPLGGVFYKSPTGSDTHATPVASGTEPDTAVYFQDFNAGPAEITRAGGLSVYGTMAQGGNVWEWEETEFDLVNDGILNLRGVRGGDWDEDFGPNSDATRRYGDAPLNGDFDNVGFRVASIPEPSSLLLGALASMGVLVWRRSLTD